MTTRLCWAAYPFSSYTSSSKHTALQTHRPSKRHSHGSFRAVRFVAALDETLASESLGASAQGFSLSRPTRPTSAQSLVMRNDAGEGSPKEADEEVRLQDLRIGCVYKGKVSAIESYGVFVDIGADTDGFVHISRLAGRRIEDVAKVGEDVCVQIIDLDLRTNIISLRLQMDEVIKENFSLTLPEQEVLNMAAARRANKLARCADNPSPRRVMSLETRRQLKAYRRLVLAERQAMELYYARSRATRTSDDLGTMDKVSKANC